ncbi:aspartate kinase [Fulvivirga sp. M361]|uniref:aspartate kinase n=1 Tax=Fulvivirga sp. M361 TaxID=2594266 RepID=UPI00117AA084|nr:aspartate kinase [Fulvivirga sp. M361]TRX61343.1 aspartate kinase [Fulvivirga sp. M361]
MIIFKFGGTSVGTPERMHKVAKLITRDNTEKIVVLSAVSGTTNTLVEIGELLLSRKQHIAQKLVDELKEKYRAFVNELYVTLEGKESGGKIINDFFTQIGTLTAIPDFNEGNNKTLLSYGELISTHLFHHYLLETAIENTLLPALDFMSIDEDGEPEVEKIGEKLSGLIKQSENTLFITQGFICKNPEGKTDNLKRGGSDYTASLIGAAIRAEEVQIWTDIDGMHNNDPRIVDNTSTVSELTFDEAAELAYFGAKILHPSSIVPAQKYSTRVRLKSTIDEQAPGTLIGVTDAAVGIRAIAAKDGITAIKVKSTRMLLAYGFLRKIFEVFEKYKTPIDMVTTSEVAVSLTIDDELHLNEIIEELKTFGMVEVDQNQSIICIVGNMISEKKGVLKKIFDAIPQVPIRMVSYGGSRNNISLLVDTNYKKEALIGLNQGIF